MPEINLKFLTKTTTMKTIYQIICTKFRNPSANNFFSFANSIAFGSNNQGRKSFLKQFYLGILISLLSTTIHAQSFIEVAGTSFEGVSSSSVAFADIDNDNDQDILIGSNLYTNDGNGSFEGGMWVPIGLGIDAVAFADIDNDNDQDVLITGVEGLDLHPITKLYTNDGNGYFEEVIEGTPFFGFYYSAIAFADIDNDNDMDVLICGYTVKAIFPMFPQTVLYLNDGSGMFVELSGTPFENVASGSITFADIDNDNDQDVLITGRNNFNVSIAKLYRNLSITTVIHKENTAVSNVSIYPNPNQGQLTVDLDELTDISIKVYDLNGRLIYHKANILDPTFQFELNAKAGIYILEVSTQQEKQQYKLVRK